MPELLTGQHCLRVVALLSPLATVRQRHPFRPLSCCPTMAPLPTFLKPSQDTNSLYTAIVLPSQQSGGLPLAFARCSNGLIPAPAYVTSLLLPATQHQSEEPGDETQDVPHHLY